VRIVEHVTRTGTRTATIEGSNSDGGDVRRLQIDEERSVFLLRLVDDLSSGQLDELRGVVATLRLDSACEDVAGAEGDGVHAVSFLVCSFTRGELLWAAQSLGPFVLFIEGDGEVAVDQQPLSLDVSGSNGRSSDSSDGSRSKGSDSAASDGNVSSLQQRRLQAAGSWSLDRLDSRTLVLDGVYSFPSWSTGAGVDVYVLDTGVRTTHVDFAATSVVQGPSFVASDTLPSTYDCHGHGTHVASMVAGALYGSAKGARVISVRVLGCDGSGACGEVLCWPVLGCHMVWCGWCAGLITWVVSGIQWAISNAAGTG
jgi:hypothetical protein